MKKFIPICLFVLSSLSSKAQEIDLFKIKDEKTKDKIEFVLNFPWGKVQNLPIQISSSKLQKNEYFKNISKDKILLNGKVYGDLSNLKFEKVNLKGVQNSSLSFSGTVKNLKDPVFDINVANLTSSKADILRIIPTDALPENINIPKKFVLKGTVNGKYSDFNSDLTISSEQGIAQLNSHIINNSKGLAYSGKISTQAYKIGDLINNTTIGALSSNIAFKGNGTNLKTADLQLSEIGRAHV
jgi:hypothetical protein